MQTRSLYTALSLVILALIVLCLFVVSPTPVLPALQAGLKTHKAGLTGLLVVSVSALVLWPFFAAKR